jgi:hypothetical protein
MHEVLISYSTKDKKWADAACSVLEARGIRCWIAPRDIVPGTEWGEAIIAGIDGSKVMVLIFSTSANESAQVRREVERAISKGLTVIPCRIENVAPVGAMEYALGNTHWLDAFTPPVESQMQRLAASVQALLPRAASRISSSRPVTLGPAGAKEEVFPGTKPIRRWPKGRRLAAAAAGASLLVLLGVALAVALWPHKDAPSEPIDGMSASMGELAPAAGHEGAKKRAKKPGRPMKKALAATSRTDSGSEADYDSLATGRWVAMALSEDDLHKIEQSGLKAPKYSNGVLECNNCGVMFPGISAKDAIIRVQMNKKPAKIAAGVHLHLVLRRSDTSFVQAWCNGDGWFGIDSNRRERSPSYKGLGKCKLSGQYQGRFFEFALAAKDNTLTLYVNGRKELEVRDDLSIEDHGGIGLGARECQGSFRNIEIQTLDNAAADATTQR